MFNLALLFACLAAGALARRFTRVPPWLSRGLNAWVLGVALPALVLRAVPGLEFQPRLFFGAGALWLVFFVAAAAALAAVKWLGLSRGKAGALGLTAGLCNTSFVGVPLLRALGGEEAVGFAVAVDQLGSFLVLPVLALPFAAACSGTGVTLGELARRLFAFPPFLAFGAALALRGVRLPEALLDGLHGVSLTLSPAALLAVGLQLELGELGRWKRELAVGLLYKLLVAPALAAAVLAAAGRPFDLLERVALCQAAMAPMVTGAVVAQQRGLEPTLASLMVGVGVPLSLLTVPLWWAFTG